MNKKPKLLSIIIPAYNEENRIPSTLKDIGSYCRKRKLHHELLVVDDGSKDRTMEVVRKARIPCLRLLSYGENRGKGYAVRFGMRQAKGDILLFSDADLSTPIEELDKFLPLLDRFDVLIGSRNLTASDIQINQPLFRQIPGRVFSIFTRLLVLPGIKDSQCGFKLFTRKAAKTIFSRQRIEGFGFDMELLFIARRHGLRVKEVPIIWRNSGESKVSLLRDPFIMLLSIMKIRLDSLAGRYA